VNIANCIKKIAVDIQPGVYKGDRETHEALKKCYKGLNEFYLAVKRDAYIESKNKKDMLTLINETKEKIDKISSISNWYIKEL
jgi:hypothetical protein